MEKTIENLNHLLGALQRLLSLHRRLLDVVRAQRGQPVDDAVAAVQDAVRAFCDGPSEDDVTILLARVR